MNPYSYPKTRHIRSERPIAHRNYRNFKSTLRREFQEKCVYCMAPDASKTDYYGVDHYRPKSLFPELSCTYANLFYACNACNSRKGAYWPKDEKSPFFIPNPCDHEMFRHLRYVGGTVDPKSEAGVWTVKTLDLNDPNAVKYREATLLLLDAAEARKKEAENLVSQLLKKRLSGEVTDPLIDAAIVATQAELEKIKDAIRLHSGR